MEKQKVVFTDLGIMEYKQAWEYQDVLMKKNLAVKATYSRKGQISQESQIGEAGRRGEEALQAAETTNHQPQTVNHLLFVEHPPVYTLGKSGKMEHVLLNEEERKERGIAFYQTNRGGDITFHGPGQIVGYPILDLENFYTDIGRYLRELEEVIILTLLLYGITAGRSAGETGVWIDAVKKGGERKICAMGVRCSRWITMHGFALNVNTDLACFDGIIPCGIQNKKVTSMEAELGHKVDAEAVKQSLKKNFEKVFGVELQG